MSNGVAKNCMESFEMALHRSATWTWHDVLKVLGSEHLVSCLE